MLFDSILPTRELKKKLEWALPNLPLLYQLGLHNILNSLLSFQHLLSIFSSYRFHLKKVLCSYARSISFVSVYHEICRNAVIYSDCTSNFSSSLFHSLHQQFLPPLKTWIPQSHLWGLKTTVCKLLLIFWSFPWIMNITNCI